MSNAEASSVGIRLRDRAGPLFDALLLAAALTSIALSTLGLRSTERLEPQRINHMQGAAYNIDLPGSRFRLLHVSDDAVEHPTSSTAALYEDHQRLGPPHALHADVVGLGSGRFSHWNGTLIFSTTDNSDPRTNGRLYEVERNWQISWTVTAGICVAVLLRCRRWIHAMFERSRSKTPTPGKLIRPLVLSRVADAIVAAAASAAVVMSSFGWPAVYPVTPIDITPAGGHSYSVPQPAPPVSVLELPDDTTEHPSSSRLTLRENGNRLRPAHSLHEDIRTLGAGRYSHWDGALLFSTGDNSDPRSNGRDYRIHVQWHLSWLVTAPILAVALWRQRRAAMQLTNVARRLFVQSADDHDATPLGPAFAVPYVVFYLAIVAAGAFWWGSDSYYHPRPIAGADQQLQNRFAYYEEHRSDFDLIFLGDSRTYCGVHPERIDPLLGTRSINLSSFSNWFPTQLAEVKRLVKTIPKDTTVVLTTGHINFSCIGDIQRVFPIDIPTALHYLTLAIPRNGLWDNVAFYNRYLHFWAVRGEIRDRFLGWASQPLAGKGLHMASSFVSRSLFAPALAAPFASDLTHVSGVADSDPPLPLSAAKFAKVLTPNITRRATLPSEVESLVREYADDLNVTLVDLNEDGGRITSLVVYYRGGGYYRIEVDHAFFREKQGAISQSPNLAEPGAQSAKAEAPQPAPACLALFSEMLDVFEQNGIHLIVNEIEEAPYTYRSEENRQAFREVMQRTVRPVVEAHGFRYVTTELGRLRDDDYFDYNHLNSQGIGKYTPMLADALRPLLASNRREVSSSNAIQ